ncbi:lysosomal acid phosphatase-like isoform X2 [Oscarella lobularis]|uniref:lysosomal acid phosphatase-like isoform X2 n=1 Tax=Oscarella lobularis TaxID=121494 RepID=UPI003313D9B0
MRVLLVLCLSVAISARQLQLASLVFRHGDRSPAGTFPTDPHQVDQWPQGWGQLTQAGMLQHYNLAQELLMKRYMTKGTETFLLSSSYKRDEIYVRSTDLDRTLMSAECLMAALYKPNGHQAFLKDFDWQPIPIHTVPVPEDKLLRGHYVCPRYKKLREEGTNDADYVEVMEQNKDLFARVKKNAGIDYDLTIDNVGEIFDLLFCEKQHKLPWADWVTKEDFAALAKVSDFALYKTFAAKEILRITAGPLLGEMLDHMETKRNNGDLKATKIPDTARPPYASIMMIELYLEDDGSSSVEVYYHMGPEADGSTDRLALPGCPLPCTLEKFKAFATSFIPENFDEECQQSSMTSKLMKSKTGAVAGFFLATAAVAIALVALAVAFCQSRLPKRRHFCPSNPFCRHLFS